MENNENVKKFVTLENLKYFLEKFKYELAHNGPKTDTNEDNSENEENKQ